MAMKFLFLRVATHARRHSSTGIYAMRRDAVTLGGIFRLNALNVGVISGVRKCINRYVLIAFQAIAKKFLTRIDRLTVPIDKVVVGTEH